MPKEGSKPLGFLDILDIKNQFRMFETDIQMNGHRYITSLAELKQEVLTV